MVPFDVPTLKKETMFAVVDAAHKQGRIAVTHSRDVQSYEDAARAGVDGFVHLPIDQVPNAALIALIKKSGAFVSPNLSVARPDGIRLLEDNVFEGALLEHEKAALKNHRLLRQEGGDIIEYQTLKKFYDAGIPIILGTDSPNGGTSVGVSLHLELELAVEAGLSPKSALMSVTSIPASHFNLSDRGRIQKGLIADVLLVDGSPDIHVKDTRNIVHIWKAGKLHKYTKGKTV